MDWPSLNQSVLIGKVSAVTRIQWSDGSSTAVVRLCTQKKIATPEGWRTGFDWHECEISPGERVFATTWPGAIVLVRGTYGSFEWQPNGATTKFNRHVLEATGFQVIRQSDKPKVMPKTVMRSYNRAAAAIRRPHERTNGDG
jgi:hypothetical protein